MTFDPSYYVHSHPDEQTTTVTLDGLPFEKVASLVNKAALNNHERQADAITKADSYSFQVAHPELIRNAENTKLINHQLTSWGITNPTYADFARAYDALKDSGLLAIDYYQQAPTTFVGALTKQTFTSLDDMIAAERQAAIQQVTPSTPEEIAFNNLPLDETQSLLKQLEQRGHQEVNAAKNQHLGDVWVTAKKEYKDTDRNALLMRQQLATNGVLESVATFADYEKAFNQLVASGLLRLDQNEVRKQHQETLRQEAADAIRNSVTPSEDELYQMPMETLERKARGF
jgi:predicted transglutaminase-like cysteine proteinase